MRVFVTGASGWVGSAVVEELVGAGHQVVGLVRSDAAAAALAAAGAEAQQGTLEDVDGLRRGAAAAEAVVHTAFNHDFSRFAENCALDRRAIAALGDGLAGSGRPMLVTSGLALQAQGRPGTEDDPAVPSSPAYPRASEEAMAALLDRGVRASVVRLPPSVHGAGDHGFVPALIGIARDKGAAAFVGDGANRWPAVHRRDAARVFRLAIERGGAGERWHAVAEDGVLFRDIAETIGRTLGVPVVGKSVEEAGAHFGWLAHFAAMDVPATSRKTQALLGWRPEGAGLLADMDQAYFTA